MRSRLCSAAGHACLSGLSKVFLPCDNPTVYLPELSHLSVCICQKIFSKKNSMFFVTYWINHFITLCTYKHSILPIRWKLCLYVYIPMHKCTRLSQWVCDEDPGSCLGKKNPCWILSRLPNKRPWVPKTLHVLFSLSKYHALTRLLDSYGSYEIRLQLFFR